MIDNAPKRIMIVPARVFIALTVPSSRSPHWRIALAQESFTGPRLSRTAGRRFAGIRACLTAILVRQTCSYRVRRMLAAISWLSACWPSAGWSRFLRLMPPTRRRRRASHVRCQSWPISVLGQVLALWPDLLPPKRCTPYHRPADNRHRPCQQGDSWPPICYNEDIRHGSLGGFGTPPVWVRSDGTARGVPDRVYPWR